jgi:hypothetical protein
MFSSSMLTVNVGINFRSLLHEMIQVTSHELSIPHHLVLSTQRKLHGDRGSAGTRFVLNRERSAVLSCLQDYGRLRFVREVV